VHAGIRLSKVSADALYIVGAATLLLVFIGIHNAWDTVMYVTVQGVGRRKAAHREAGAEPPKPAAGKAVGKAVDPPS
jgi:hypothetical protein